MTHLCTDAKLPEYGEAASVGRAGRRNSGRNVWLLAAEAQSSAPVQCEEGEREKKEEVREEGSKEGKVGSVSQERFIARGQSARRPGLFQEQSVNPH